MIGVIKFTGQDDIIDNAPDGYELAGVEFMMLREQQSYSSLRLQHNLTQLASLLELLDGVDNYITAEFKADVLTGQQQRKASA